MRFCIVACALLGSAWAAPQNPRPITAADFPMPPVRGSLRGSTVQEADDSDASSLRTVRESTQSIQNTQNTQNTQSIPNSRQLIDSPYNPPSSSSHAPLRWIPASRVRGPGIASGRTSLQSGVREPQTNNEHGVREPQTKNEHGLGSDMLQVKISHLRFQMKGRFSRAELIEVRVQMGKAWTVCRPTTLHPTNNHCINGHFTFTMTNSLGRRKIIVTYRTGMNEFQAVRTLAKTDYEKADIGGIQGYKQKEPVMTALVNIKAGEKWRFVPINAHIDGVQRK